VPRVHLVELEDLAWFPTVMRDAGVAYLRFVANAAGHPAAMQPVIESALDRSGEKEIFDLCSGGGGPAIAIADGMRESGRDVRLTLTDFFPSPGTRAAIAAQANPALRYLDEPVDATSPPPAAAGLRTFFNSFHHFRPDAARNILAGAVADRRPIAVVEVLQRHPLVILAMILAPLMSLAIVPFLRPFRVAWLPLTYVIPAIPLFIGWDGLVSSVRAYSRDELLALAAEADAQGEFEWRVEEFPLNGSPAPGIALTGVPKSRDA
jgi:hypothetical protein